MKRALVLSGGGGRGAFQVGMLLELVVERGLDFEVIRGVSVGSVNAAFLAQAPTGPDSLANLSERVVALERLWRREIRGNESVYSKRGGFPGILAGADSLFSLKPLRALLKKHVSTDALRRSGRDFKVGTVSLVTGRYEEAGPEDPDFFEKLVASSSIPVVFPFVVLEKAKDVLVDGGVRNISPIAGALESGADEIYVLLASRILRDADDEVPPSAAEPQDFSRWKDGFLGTAVTGFDVLERTLDLLTDEIYLNDIRGAIRWMPVDLRVLAPRVWFDESAPPGRRNSSREFDPSLVAAAIDHGREIARDPTLWLWPPPSRGIHR